MTAAAPKLQGAIKAPRTDSLHEIMLEDLLSRIVQPYDLTPVMSDALRGIRIPHADQVDESNLVFLTPLGCNNATFAIKNGRAMLVVGDGRRPSCPAPLQRDVRVYGGALTWDAFYPDRLPTAPLLPTGPTTAPTERAPYWSAAASRWTVCATPARTGRRPCAPGNRSGTSGLSPCARGNQVPRD